MRGVLTDSEFNGAQVTYFVRLPDGSEMRVIVADPFCAADRSSLGTALDLYWSPRGLRWCSAPSVVPGAENMPGAQDLRAARRLNR